MYCLSQHELSMASRSEVLSLLPELSHVFNCLFEADFRPRRP